MRKKIKHLIIVVLMVMVSPFTFGQDITFIKAFGDNGYDYGRDIQQDTDTGYVITGSSSSFGPDNGEAYLLKINKYGDFEWSHNYGGEGSDWGEGLIVTNDSTYAIGGYTNSFGAGGFDFYLVRIGNEGIPLWEKTFGGPDWDKAYSIIQLPDSGFVLAGETYSYNDGIVSGYIVKTDKEGNLEWQNVIESEFGTYFRDLDIDGDSLVICGAIGDGGESTYDGYIYKCHIDGTFGWDHVVGREHNDYFNAVDVVDSIYSFGGARSYRYDEMKENMWMYKLKDDGEFIVDTTYGNEEYKTDIIHDIAVRDFDQDFYYVGQSESYGYILDNKPDIFIGKMTSYWLQLTAVTYGEKGNDIGRAIQRTNDGGVVVLCESEFYETGGNNLIVIKLDYYWEYPPIEDLGEFNNITTSIHEESQNLPTTIYPNPFTNVINFGTPLNGNLTVRNLAGKTYLMSENFNGNSIDLSNLSSGVYILTLEKDDIIYHHKLIKN